jgi:tetratricopeptide (TPR) repeat protein
MRKAALYLLCLFFLLYPLPREAAVKTFVRDFTYQATEMDSKVSCRMIALEQAKRLLLEELGTYVESTTVVQNFQLVKDEITTFAAGVVQTSILEERWNGKEYWLKAQIIADPEEVALLLESVRKDSLLRKELEEARQEAVQALKEIEKLKEQLALADREKIQRYTEAVNQLMATDWFEKGSALSMAGDYREAANAFDRVILLRPNDPKGYSSRGFVYILMGDNRQGIQDYNRAVKLNPRYSKLYYTREFKKPKATTQTIIPDSSESRSPETYQREPSSGSKPTQPSDPTTPSPPRYSTGERSPGTVTTPKTK